MIHFQSPILVRINEGISINMSQTVSYAIERDAPKMEIKPEIEKQVQDKTLNRRIEESDYNEVGKSDTVSFWFVGGTSLAYRVSEVITQNDFNRIVKDLSSLLYKAKDDRKPSTDKDTKTSN